MRRRFVRRRVLSWEEQFQKDHSECLPRLNNDINNDRLRNNRMWDNLCASGGTDFFKAQRRIHGRDTRV